MAAEWSVRALLGKQKTWPPGFLRFCLRHGRSSLRVPTHMTLEERMLLYRLGLRIPRGGRIVEIGSYVGASSCVLAGAASERRGILVCVDTWANEGMSEGPRDTYDELLANTERFRRWIRAFKGRSQDVARHAQAGAIDLLFVDGCHEYDAVITDLRDWLPKVRPHGWVALHDYGWAKGVRKAVEECVWPLETGVSYILPNLYAAQVTPVKHVAGNREAWPEVHAEESGRSNGGHRG